MSRTHNTSISKVAHWDWRLPPGDRRSSEVRTYYLSKEELEKYRRGGTKKMEEVKTYQTEKRSLKQALEEDFVTGKKTIEQIAEELGIKPFLVKAQAARLGYLEKKEKPQKAEIKKTDTASDVLLKQVEFSGKFSYVFRDGKLTIRQDKERRLVLSLNEIDALLKDIGEVLRQINSLGG